MDSGRGSCRRCLRAGGDVRTEFGTASRDTSRRARVRAGVLALLGILTLAPRGRAAAHLRRERTPRPTGRSTAASSSCRPRGRRRSATGSTGSISASDAAGADPGLERARAPPPARTSSRATRRSSSRRPTSPVPPARHGRIAARATSGRIYAELRHLPRRRRRHRTSRRLTDTPGYDAEATVCAARTARSSSPRCATATSSSTGWTPTATNVNAPDQHARLRRRRVLQRRLQQDRVARVAADEPRSWTTTSACWRRTWCGRPSWRSTWRTPTAATPRQVTYLDAASFAPSSTRRGTASSSPEPRRSAGARVRPLGDRHRRRQPGAHHARARLRRLPDVLARRHALAFASNRATPPGAHDTNVFVARWVEQAVRRRVEPPRPTGSRPTSRWLADPAREGRGVGTPGLDGGGRRTSRSA